MATHTAACRRWRACVAMHNLLTPRQSPSCASSHKRGEYPHGHWLDLTSYISAMESSDLVRKTEALHQLSLFLLYMAPTSESSFNCPDAKTVCVSFQNKDIFLALKDVQVLYKLLFYELANHTAWLFTQQSGLKKSESTFSINISGSQCDSLDLVFIVKVLRCCLHILPLLEFDTGLSLVAAEALMSLLKRLTCPTNLFQYSVNEMMDKHRKQLQKSNCIQVHGCFENSYELSNAPMLFIASVKAAIKGLQENFSMQINTNSGYSHIFQENIMACSFHTTPAHTDRNQITRDLLEVLMEENLSIRRNTNFGYSEILKGNITACYLHSTPTQMDRHQIARTLLEVFMEELLLQPHLAEILMASDVLDSSKNSLSCESLTMEAAAMHFIHSFFEVDYFKAVQDIKKCNNPSCNGSRMSLPAAVMLLDLSMVNAPDLFLLHIVNMLISAFNEASCLTLELPGGVVMGLAMSALESAVALYLRCWKHGPLPSQHNLSQHGELLNCLSDKFWAMCDGDNEKVASILELLFNTEDFADSGQQEHRPRHPSTFFSCVADVKFCGDRSLQCSFCAIRSACYDSVHKGQEPEQVLPTNSDCFSLLGSGTRTAFLVSVLHLMSTALLCLVHEADKHGPSLSLSPLPNVSSERGGVQTSVNAEVCVSSAIEIFKFCASVDRTNVLEELKLDKEVEDAVLKVDKLTENAFSFFLERLHISLKQGSPKALCEAYLLILRSLLTFFVSFEQRRKLAESTSDEKLCEAPLMLSNDATMTLEEEQNIGSPCGDGNVHKRNSVSSTLLLTKMYQCKRRKVVSAKENSQNLPRMNETKLVAESEHMDNVSCPLKMQEKGRFRKHRLLAPKSSSSSNGSTFIKEVIAHEGKVDGDCFNDLNDFIVCKEGRNYSKWMKSLYKKRKKKQAKMIWQRLKAKRALVSLLTRRHNDFKDFQMCNTS